MVARDQPSIDRKTFVVLGMHRSATSLVAKSLAHEIHMGKDLLPPNGDNPTGFWENIRFIALNERILEAAGGSWWEPPSESSIVAQGKRFSDEIEALLSDESKGKSLWGWKDPRTTLTVRLYLPHLMHPHFICCFRDPNEIAQSQLRVSQLFPGRPQRLTLSQWTSLAREYNRRLLAFLSDRFVQSKS